MGALLSFIFFPFLSLLAIIATFRAGKILMKIINGLFNRIEDKFS
jgi:hypothetical protein